MGKGAKISVAGSAVAVAAIIGAIMFVSPTRALSAAIMRDCIGVVKQKTKGVEIISATAIQPEPNRRKVEDFNRATQAVISRGDIVPSEPSVLIDFRTDRGDGKALCTYFVELETGSGTYSGVSAHDVQIGLNSLSGLEMAFMKRFDVGRLDRALSLIPIFGVVQKFYLD
ncbi:hypothetical protein [Pseudomonas sp. FP2338]|uniref:hypothetical protein n=1 Tax=Pseudomonas sp. FP2338 TaxID=2954093 RepID=UPI002734A4A9|nr:hypothetical protein [Pseudomonas sp. FP2338]WLH86035.1 hypothetical protein PSH96_06195 [Pseudomonas sp. FP2338]